MPSFIISINIYVTGEYLCYGISKSLYSLKDTSIPLKHVTAKNILGNLPGKKQ